MSKSLSLILQRSQLASLWWCYTRAEMQGYRCSSRQSQIPFYERHFFLSEDSYKVPFKHIQISMISLFLDLFPIKCVEGVASFQDIHVRHSCFYWPITNKKWRVSGSLLIWTRNVVTGQVTSYSCFCLVSPAVHNEQPAVHCHETEIRKLLCVTAFCSCFGCCTISKQVLKGLCLTYNLLLLSTWALQK